MSILDTHCVVLKKSSKKIDVSNISYFISIFCSDCPICLQFQKSPVLSLCGHIFCQECLKISLDYSNRCPVCSKEINQYWKTKIYIREGISDFLLFKRLTKENLISQNIKNYEVNPFCRIYYEESDEENVPMNQKSFCSALYPKDKEKDYIFYQSANGDPWFLNNTFVINNCLLETGPMMIFSKIKSYKKVIYSKKYHKNLSHLKDGSVIYIVDIEAHSSVLN